MNRDPVDQLIAEEEKWMRDLRRACRKVPAHVSCDRVGHLARLMSVGRKCWPW